MGILKDISTRAPEGMTKKEARAATKKMNKRISELQEIMMAEKKHSLLVVFQGMDSSGKDGATHGVFNECSPHGIHAVSYKKPTDEEFAHDFLWRIHKHAPQKGHISVFIRSHYEDVLIQRVHKWITEEHAIKRINAINAFEELLQFDNNTTVLKFYMHLSHERQGEKLQERLDEPDKNWKHNDGDWAEREHWDEYMRCYEDLFERCTIPWIIAPVDDRWYRDYFITKKILETMEGFNMLFPKLKTEKFLK